VSGGEAPHHGRTRLDRQRERKKRFCKKKKKVKKRMSSRQRTTQFGGFAEHLGMTGKKKAEDPPSVEGLRYVLIKNT